MAPSCPSENTEAVDQSSFWDSGNLNWDEHRIGWAIAGGCAALVSSCSPRARVLLLSHIKLLDSDYYSNFCLQTLSVRYW